MSREVITDFTGFTGKRIAQRLIDSRESIRRVAKRFGDFELLSALHPESIPGNYEWWACEYNAEDRGIKYAIFETLHKSEGPLPHRSMKRLHESDRGRVLNVVSRLSETQFPRRYLCGFFRTEKKAIKVEGVLEDFVKHRNEIREMEKELSKRKLSEGGEGHFVGVGWYGGDGSVEDQWGTVFGERSFS